MRRTRDESGASLVEFALVLPLLVLLVFGVIEFGTVYNNYLSVRGGVREGARQAVVGNIGSTTSCNNSTYAGGIAATQEIICLTKDRIGSLTGVSQAEVRVNVVADNYAVGQPVVVCAEVPMKSFTGLFAPFLNGRYLKTKVQMRIENLGTSGVTSGSNISGSETAASGSWNCSVTST